MKAQMIFHGFTLNKNSVYITYIYAALFFMYNLSKYEERHNLFHQQFLSNEPLEIVEGIFDHFLKTFSNLLLDISDL